MVYISGAVRWRERSIANEGIFTVLSSRRESQSVISTWYHLGDFPHFSHLWKTSLDENITLRSYAHICDLIPLPTGRFTELWWHYCSRRCSEHASLFLGDRLLWSFDLFPPNGSGTELSSQQWARLQWNLPQSEIPWQYQTWSQIDAKLTRTKLHKVINYCCGGINQAYVRIYEQMCLRLLLLKLSFKICERKTIVWWS